MIDDQVEEAGIGATKVAIKYDPDESALNTCKATNLYINSLYPVD